jgi:hypothetical protein
MTLRGGLTKLHRITIVFDAPVPFVSPYSKVIHLTWAALGPKLKGRSALKKKHPT